MNITDAQYKVDLDGVTKTIIRTTIDGTVYDIPLDPNNRHYAEIQRLVKTGQLKIKEAND